MCRCLFWNLSPHKSRGRALQNAIQMRSIEGMHNALLPAMCCNLNEFTRIGTYEAVPQKDKEVLNATAPEVPVKSKRVGRPRIYDDVDLSKLTEQEIRKVRRCQTNRESARRVREAKVTKVFILGAGVREGTAALAQNRLMSWGLTSVCCR